MTTTDAAERIAESVWLRLLSRGAMISAAPLMLVFGYIGDRYLNAQSEQISALISHQTSEDTAAAILATRVTVIETDRARAMTEAAEVRTQIINKLDNLSAGQSDTQSKIAALSATIDALKDQLKSSPSR